MVYLQFFGLSRGRTQVITKRSGQHLTVLIINQFLPEGAPISLEETTVNLAFYNQRIKKSTRIMNGDIFEDFSLACFRVNFNCRNITNESIRGRGIDTILGVRWQCFRKTESIRAVQLRFNVIRQSHWIPVYDSSNAF